MKKRTSIVLIAVFLLTMLVFPSAALEAGDDPTLIWINAAEDEPENYQSITGFTITYRLVKGGYMGSEAEPFPVNGLMIARGKCSIDQFTWDGESSLPKFIGPADDLVAHVTGDGSFVGTMFFKNGIDGGGAQEGESISFTYEGTEHLFDDENSFLTAHMLFNTEVEIESIQWIMGEVKEATPKLEWESVETVVYNDVPTVENGTEFNYVNITVPKGDGPYPVIFWIHGGGWTQLDRYSCFISDTMDYLLSKGFAVVSAEYTKSVDGDPSVSGYPQMIYDLKAAVRFLRANADTYHLDTSFIAAMGESAGAHLAMLMGTTNGNSAYEDLTMGNEGYSSDVQAMISYFGPADCVSDPMMAYAILGEDHTSQDAMAVSPYYQISKDSPPLYLTHGKDDATVSVTHSEKMEERAKTLLGEENVTAKYYDHAPHANIAAFDSDEAILSVEAFLTKHLTEHRENVPEVPETQASAPSTDPVDIQPEEPGTNDLVIIGCVVAVIAVLAVVGIIVWKKRK